MEFKIKWTDGNYDGIDDEDITNGYKEYCTKVECKNGEVFFAVASGMGNFVEVDVWRRDGIGTHHHVATSFTGAKRWASNLLKKYIVNNGGV